MGPVCICSFPDTAAGGLDAQPQSATTACHHRPFVNKQAGPASRSCHAGCKTRWVPPTRQKRLPKQALCCWQSLKGVSSVCLHGGCWRQRPSSNSPCALHLQVAAARQEVEERLSARLQEVHNRLTAQQALGQDRQQEMAASNVWVTGTCANSNEP